MLKQKFKTILKYFNTIKKPNICLKFIKKLKLKLMQISKSSFSKYLIEENFMYKQNTN